MLLVHPLEINYVLISYSNRSICFKNNTQFYCRCLQILAMVEEAAGTRMYETKKQAAEKTIERKDAKLRELNEVCTVLQR